MWRSFSATEVHMAAYSTSIRCRELEPVYFSGNRAEFRMPEGALFTNNLHLMNLGVTKSTGTEVLNKLTGCLGTISRISLLDGNVELQSLTRANEWLGIRQHLHSNAYNEDVGSMLVGNRKSSRFNVRDTTGQKTGTDAQQTTVVVGAKMLEGGSRQLQSAVGATEATTFKGQLDLSEALTVLQSMPYLDTGYFKGLRIVVEFDVRHATVMGGGQDAGTLAQARPLLVVEEVIAPDIVEANMGKTPPVMQYKVIETDVFSVPALSPAGSILTQPQTFHVSSLNNKSIGRCLIATRATLATTQLTGAVPVEYGLYNSHAMIHQKNQVRVNGRNLFARDGITRENQRLALMADTWGRKASIRPFQHGLAYREQDTIPRTNYIDTGNESIGTADYFAWDLDGARVTDLQLDYERQSFQSSVGGAQVTACKYNSALDLVMFAEVMKSIVPQKGGGYNVMYQ